MEFSIDASKDGMLLISNKKGLYKNENIFIITGVVDISMEEPVWERDNSEAFFVEKSWKASIEAASIFVNFKTKGKIRKAIPIKVAKNTKRWKIDNFFPEK